MPLTAAEFRRAGAGGGITDLDGRMISVDAGGVSDSISTSASVSAPGAGGTVIAVGGLVVGAIYRISGTLTLTGTAETALANARIVMGGVAITGGGQLPTLTGIVIPFGPVRVTGSGSATLGILAIAAATAGSVYTANVVIQRVE